MTQAIQIADDDTFSPVRALSSLTSAQANQIIAGLSGLAATWTITRHEGCDGQLSLLVAHAVSDTALVVDRDTTGIALSLMLGDEIHASRHRYTTTSDTVAAIKVVAASPNLELKRLCCTNLTTNVERLSASAVTSSGRTPVARVRAFGSGR